VAYLAGFGDSFLGSLLYFIAIRQVPPGS